MSVPKRIPDLTDLPANYDRTVARVPVDTAVNVAAKGESWSATLDDLRKDFANGGPDASAQTSVRRTMPTLRGSLAVGGGAASVVPTYTDDGVTTKKWQLAVGKFGYFEITLIVSNATGAGSNPAVKKVGYVLWHQVGGFSAIGGPFLIVDDSNMESTDLALSFSGDNITVTVTNVNPGCNVVVTADVLEANNGL